MRRAYTCLPENEDLTMHLAEIAGIKVVPHTLARMADGELCYLTRRIDRDASGVRVAVPEKRCIFAYPYRVSIYTTLPIK